MQIAHEDRDHRDAGVAADAATLNRAMQRRGLGRNQLAEIAGVSSASLDRLLAGHAVKAHTYGLIIRALEKTPVLPDLADLAK